MKLKVEQTLSGLKDFQRKTVDYVFGQFQKGRTHFLIADEVGLGKTIVAKGIIARLYEHDVLQEHKKSFNVVYVCSNQAIAKANIGKLNFTHDRAALSISNDDDRITSLAYENSFEQDSSTFKIRAFTPATSFDDKTHAGRKDERVLLYRLLYQYEDFKSDKTKNGLMWILRGNNRISPDSWEEAIKNVENGNPRRIRAKVKSEFRKKLDKVISPDQLPKSFRAAGINHSTKYWTLIRKLCDLEVSASSFSKFDFIRELVAHLRLTLSQACISFLNADIFILDEFQRFKKLIDISPVDGGQEKLSPATELARAIFFTEGNRILMLSATPFKAYTNGFDELHGEVHHKEFETVLKFLNPELQNNEWQRFDQMRNDLFSVLRHSVNNPDEKAKAVKIKSDLELFYRSCIVRTERLAVSRDRDSLIRPMKTGYLMPEIRDLEDFLAIDKLTVYLNEKKDKHKTQLPIPIEYVKSSPYALSFLDGYQHRRRLLDALSDDGQLRNLLKKINHAWVDMKAVRKYRQLSKPLPNAKLRLLIKETISNGGWKLLWVPPSMPYYDLGGPFANIPDFSKTLVFSSWLLVPKMISTLVSYEAERLSIGNPDSLAAREENVRDYFSRKRHPRPQILYRLEKEEKEAADELVQPANIIYLYPSLFLARVYDPQQNLVDRKSPDKLKESIKLEFKLHLRSSQIQDLITGTGEWKDWFWCAPLLLDKVMTNNEVIYRWFENGLPKSESMTDSESLSQSNEITGKSVYFKRMANFFNDAKTVYLPRLTDHQLEEVADYLATLTLASPAICYLRTQQREASEVSLEMMNGAFEVASGFVTTFNKPESIAVIRLSTNKDAGKNYLDRVLEYSIAGNIQALLDEYFYLIREQEGLSDLQEVATHISDVLTIRSSTTKVDDAFSILSENARAKSLRTHFAVDFSGQKLSTAKTSGRLINIRQAFNSPFRPFVLATTSIGQEGLDFHLYCRKIFHWNLPANAIDIEQREGRINRYKGLVIRQNLVKKYSRSVTLKENKSAWDEVFQIAKDREVHGTDICEMVPFWHTEPAISVDNVDPVKIERFVPLYAFSRDINKYIDLQKILAFYRITFGQPRQDELIMALADSVGNYDYDEIKDLLINLSPWRFVSEFNNPHLFDQV